MNLVPRGPTSIRPARRRHPAVEGLRRAELVDGPKHITQPDTENVGIKVGRRFEKSFGLGLSFALKELRREKQLAGELYSGQWIVFEDQRGPGGLVQVDHFVVFPAGVVVFECKNTETEEAYPQLMRYAPLLGFIFARPVRMVAVFRIMNGQTKLPMAVSSLWECLIEGPALRYWHVPHRDYIYATPRLARQRSTVAENSDG